MDVITLGIFWLFRFDTAIQIGVLQLPTNGLSVHSFIHTISCIHFLMQKHVAAVQLLGWEDENYAV